ncbi:shikimate dehydrogenase [Fibrobacter sp. UWB11]|uniref:shikimate dehydrogenase n=1 Tax=Fibrobacter sp. UWB11 TaxID=1896202 RepID=UPI0009408332|nr:shikimate dehydrogenase [Fibrobacter sp. UWB11]
MASINGKTETLCIFGHPVAHSKSPAMHNALFAALGINAAYLPYAPEPENFAEAIKGFKAMKFRGANVTIPYKTEFFNADGSARLVDELSEISKFTGSANTLYWKDGIVGGTLCGTTTDPYGCVRNLEENGVSPSNKKIALLGNGGAAQSIAFTLVEQENELTIVCRSKEKGETLAGSLNKFFQSGNAGNKNFKTVQITTFGEFANISANFDIIINATSVGMSPNVNDSPLTSECLHKGQVVCDIVYTPPRTKLLQMAEANGCKIVTGEGMLVHQGLESFKKWFPKETENKTNEELVAIMRKGMQG